MKSRAIFFIQKSLLTVSWALCSSSHRPGSKTISWVVGPDDIASMASQIHSVLPRSRAVILSTNKFFTSDHDWTLRRIRPRWRYAASLVLGPIVLGYLVTRARGFVYVGSGGYLVTEIDQRSFEFAFLKRHGALLCCYWTGNDIRSNVLMHELEARTGEPNTSTYQGFVSPRLETAAYDETKKVIAAVADLHADIMFSFPTSQRSYLRTRPETPMYFFPDDQIASDLSRFNHVTRPLLVHAPSSPIGKGTPLVRAAIAQLRQEGYDFEYVELLDMPNEVVLEHLQRAHIALNHFYGAQPGVFGVEAMAAGCVMLTSADETVETRLPQRSNDAWVVTKHHEVLSKLRALLDSPESWRTQAARGVRWVEEHGSASGSGARLRDILGSVAEGSYMRGDSEPPRP